MLKRFLLIVLILLIPCSCLAFEVTSPFGWRVHPISGEYKFHSGVDIGLDYGTPVLALFNGTVVVCGVYGGYGNIVLLKHDEDHYTLYGHCADILVQPGQYVGAGDPIATVGSTGYSTGPHLHLEYWVNGQYVDPMVIWQQ